MSTPYLLLIGDLKETIEQVFLVTDCSIITEVKQDDSPLVLLSSYFVYNICYPKGCNNLFSFLEVMFFDSSLDKLAPTVKQFYASIFVLIIFVNLLSYFASLLFATHFVVYDNKIFDIIILGVAIALVCMAHMLSVLRSTRVLTSTL